MKFYPLRIQDLRRETNDCISIAFDVPSDLASIFQYTQGQYLTLRTTIDGAEVRRSYSLCSSPLDGEWRVAIKRVEGGVFSTFANQQLKKNDILEVMPPMGKFFTPLEPSVKKQYVLFAAGSGITPILSILKTLLASEPLSEISLVYGNRNAQSVLFREAIEGLKNKYLSRLRVYHVLSRERLDSDLFYGRIDAPKMRTLLAKIPDLLRGNTYFICGPEAMTQDIRSELTAHNVATQNIHFELFGTAHKTTKYIKPVAAAPKSIALVTLDGMTTQVPLYDRQMVLDAALEMGMDLPFACKGGVCCTCRAMLLSGTVEMEVNYSLEADELARGFILTCQARATSEQIVVDFDMK